ncbi:hypothetical protein AMTR_s00045p00226340 [Amborella trichopoda]|uniref:Uncharacterized protein n=1 Tax=Amborella trichopoda TaxID=13333 RepID=W1P3N4_AMBTC|nr:hypothetical protein AMTR_s00045p00226340 [Amborella trichopoda]
MGTIFIREGGKKQSLRQASSGSPPYFNSSEVTPRRVEATNKEFGRESESLLRETLGGAGIKAGS